MEERENGRDAVVDLDDEVCMGESVSAEELVSRARARAEARNEIIVLSDDEDSTSSTRNRNENSKVTQRYWIGNEIRGIGRFAAPSVAFTQLQGSLRGEEENDGTSIVIPGVTPAAVTVENDNAGAALQTEGAGVHISTNNTALPTKPVANFAVADGAPDNAKKPATLTTKTLPTAPMKTMVGQPKALSASNKRKHDDTSQSVMSGYFQSSRPAHPPPAARYIPLPPSRYIPPLTSLPYPLQQQRYCDPYYQQPPLANNPPNCNVPYYFAQCPPTSYEYMAPPLIYQFRFDPCAGGMQPAQYASARPDVAGESGMRWGSHDRCGGRRVYVGNLDYRVAWQDLGDHMSAAGAVIHSTVMTMNDGRSKGFGIVEYGTVEEANAAVVRLNRTVLLGRKIVVREDRK